MLVLALLALGCGGASGARPDGGARAGSGGASGGTDAAAGSGGGKDGKSGGGGAGVMLDAGLACDTNGDGLDDAPTCVTAPVTLRFVNATATDNFDVWIPGAAAPVAAALAPFAVATVGPVQARAFGWQFRRADGAQATGSASPGSGTHDTIVVYASPATSPPSLATSWAPQPVPGQGGCAPNASSVVFGDFTTLLPAPVVVLFATNGGADWTPAVSPGLAVGEVAGSGCWTQSTPVVIGAAPAGATHAARAWEAATFGGLHSYQLLLTDTRAIVIDDLDAVSYLLPYTAPPADAGLDARD
ncbi:MAG TPA: hypothetical protein VKZ18_02775 [Polyangia bacterium]|nr:hypothetical protein [Polyangia bacterium]